jgi:hypothetical protein
MKKVLTLLTVLALVGTASATVRVFVTTSSDAGNYGLENDANHMVPTVSTVIAAGDSTNGIDYADYYGVPGPLRPAAYPPANAPSGDLVTPVPIADGDFAYIWLQFQNEPKGSKINGLTVEITGGPVSTTYYLCNNLQSYPAIAVKRWDGTATPPGYPEWHNNPQTMVGVTAYGIQNFGTSKPDQLWDGTGRIALLGAVEAAADGTVFNVAITNINYSAGVTPTVAGGVFQFLPEPTSLLLMSLAGLLIRRR